MPLSLSFLIRKISTIKGLCEELNDFQICKSLGHNKDSFYISLDDKDDDDDASCLSRSISTII